MSPSVADRTMLDDAWLAAPPRRSRLRLALVVLLAAAVVFLGGVEVQKRYGATPAAAVGALPAGLPGGLSGFPGGAEGLAGGAGGAAGGAAAGSSPSAAAGTATDATAVIGTLQRVSGDVWLVKDLGGTVHRVTVGSTVKVVQEKTLDAGSVAAGSTVDVSGSTDTQGRVTATTITIR